MGQQADPGVQKAAISVAILAVVFLLSFQGIKPPAAKPATAAASVFSAQRAFEILKRLVGDDVPHPVGSAANEAVRSRVVSELKGLGYEPEVQTAFACSQYGTCATVSNVVARLPGANEKNPPASDGMGANSSVLLCAHYDSVPAGPGVSDDGVGVAAVLEVARALKALPPPKNPVVILIDDGEEGGLLGARAFVESHHWARSVRAAVNVEARGTSGPSLMFETGSANQWAVRLFGSRAAYPSTSSIDYTVYKRLPNDTDFTIFKAAGYQGLNFAFIGDQPHYHTPLDNIGNANLTSLQHHGENALSATVALANADLSKIPEREDIYFDLFQTRIVRFDAKWAAPLALITLLVLALQVAWLFRHKRLSFRQLLWGLLLWLAIPTTTAILAVLLRRLMRLGSAMLVDWIAHPFPLQLAFWSLAAAVVFTLGILFGRRVGFWGLWAGMWAWLATLSLIAALIAPGISYIFLVPTGIAAIFSIPAIFVRNSKLDAGLAAAAVAVPVAAAGVVGFSPLLLLYDGMGNRALPFIATGLAISLTALLPCCADISNSPGMHGAMFSWIPITVSLTAAFLAVILPQFSTQAPERVNIRYWKDADTGVAQWIVAPASGRLPEPIAVAAAFKRADQGPFPWDRGPAYLTSAPRLAASAPSFTILESSLNGARRTYRALLRSERGAPEVLALFPPKSGVEDVWVRGHSLGGGAGKQRSFFGDWNVYRCLAMPNEGVEMAFTLPSGKALQLYVVDVTYGLPAEGKFLLNSRPLTAVSSQDGDVTMVSRSVQFIP